MRFKITALIIITSSLILVSGCQQPKAESKPELSQNNLLMATLFNNYAAEYDALAYQAYNIATERLLKTRKLNPDKDNLAVILDLDETILNNTAFEAELILKNKSYNYDLWLDWVKKANATAVPGSLEFLKLADSLHVNIFYVSNRRKSTELEASIENVKKLGFPQAEKSHFFLKENARSKELRRKAISEDYIIVLLIGDNLGDFYEDSADYETRRNLMLKNKGFFGKKFIALPNAMYGEWPKSLGLSGNEKAADSILRSMIR